jgi:large subunit ribosomal protein L31
MKAKIHPQYYPNAKVVCACGNTFTTGSTLPQIKVDICSSCHPFFTGQQKYVDTMGRVEKFQAKQKAALVKQLAAKKKKQGLQQRTRPQTLKEMFQNAR